jgi:hypothetical protein
MICDKVGAMLYISSHLTFLMLAIVPPISLGAVGVILLISIRTYRAFDQVFYGRYLKRLSNKTQEALGDMSKVKPLPHLNMKVLKVGFVGRPGSFSRPSHCTSLQRSRPRREEVF